MINKCCGIKLIPLNTNIIDMTVKELHVGFCGVCGTLYEEKTYLLDDEEILDLVGNNAHIKDCVIIKELMNNAY